MGYINIKGINLENFTTEVENFTTEDMFKHAYGFTVRAPHNIE